jgi:hypothetical protein
MVILVMRITYQAPRNCFDRTAGATYNAGTFEERGVWMYLRNKRILFSIGSLCLAASILINRFGGESRVVAFMSGMLIGISLVFLVAYLVLMRRKRDSR